MAMRVRGSFFKSQATNFFETLDEACEISRCLVHKNTKVRIAWIAAESSFNRHGSVYAPFPILKICDTILYMRYLKLLILAKIAFFLSPIDQINAQTESPAQTVVLEIVQPVTPKKIAANVTPLFWKAEINDSKITLPLRNIVYYGVQNYVIDDLIKVRELTISTNAQSLVRIYHIRPLSTVKKAAETLNSASKIENLQNIVAGKAGADDKLPVKVFPTTTHANMVEYRVKDDKQIDELYSHLESTMIEYHARTLIPSQRNLTVREIKIKD
ncbi:MAG: hypothetical protein L3J39_16540 [Verrucomicrobiales bacterium]|nr:hypothetical protein [Verrucomicrobiales bacterium]